MEINNRKSKFNYEFLETYTAGIKLLGSEVKSIRLGDVSMDESFCLLTNDGIILKNMYIKEYEFAGKNQDTLRDRVLLLNKSEINRITKSLIDKGITLIPYKLFLDKRGLVKVNIAIARGNKNYDKRQNLKKKDIERELKRDNII